MAITEKDLAGALFALYYEMHPMYANTTGWRGGIGGQAITRGCSLLDPPHGNEDPAYHVEGILRQWLTEHQNEVGDIRDLASKVMKGEVRG